MKKRETTYYKVCFTDQNERYEICAREVSPSDLYGLVEISGFIFPDSKLVYNPGEERLRREFDGIRRTWLPYHAIVRIDEMLDSRVAEVKIIPLGSPPRAVKEQPLRKPD